MRILIGAVVCLGMFAQDTSVIVRSSVDLNGRRVTDGTQVVRTKSASGSEATERTQSINGRTVPLERVEERVLRDDAAGRVVERIVQRFDSNGNPSPPVKQTIDEQKRQDGSSTIQTTTYQGDINGRLTLFEKVTTEVQKSASGETAQTVVVRPTLNGSVDTVEKQSKVVVKDGDAYSEDTTTYRRDGNGGFGVALRKVKEHSERSGQSSDTTADYEIGADGRLQLHGQTVARTIVQADGSRDATVDIFGPGVPGTAASGGLKLQEQQVVQTKPGPDQTVVETLSVRRPTVSDPNVLGPARQLSQTTCKGKCTP